MHKKKISFMHSRIIFIYNRLSYLWIFQMKLNLFFNPAILRLAYRDLLSGLGYSQAFAAFCVVSYYCALMALTLYYLAMSFQSELPWSICHTEWRNYCIDANSNNSIPETETRNVTVQSSAELYFRFQSETIFSFINVLIYFFKYLGDFQESSATGIRVYREWYRCAILAAGNMSIS